MGRRMDCLASSATGTEHIWKFAMTSESSKEIDWTAFSRVYDLMAENNPAYQEILTLCLETVKRWNLRPGSKILDLGGGTGNFSVAIARACPQCQIVQADSSAEMNMQAAQK